MNIKFETKQLRKVLPVIKKMISTANTSSLPILKNIILVAKNDSLLIKTTNLDCFASINIGKIEIENEGEMLIPGDLFVSYITKFKSKFVSIKQDGQTATIKSSTFRAKINCFDINDFVTAPESITTIGVKVKHYQLVRALECTIPFSAKGEYNPILCGILFRSTEENLRIVGTDSYRLSEFICDKEKTENITDFILPNKTALILLDILKNTKDDEVEIKNNGNMVQVQNDNFSFQSSLFEGTYPAYESIMQIKANTKLTVLRAELLEQLKLHTLTADGSKISLKIDKDFVLEALGQNGTSNSTVALEKISGDKVETVLNADYLIQIFDLLKNKKYDIIIEDSLRPILIIGKKFNHLVMPIKK